MRYLLLCLFLFTSCEYIPQNKVVMQADNTRFNIMYPDSTLSSTYVDSAYTAFKDSMLNVKLDSLSSELAYYVDVCLPDLMLRILAIETGSGATELVWNKNIDPVKRPT